MIQRLAPLALLALPGCQQEVVEGEPVSRIEIGKGEIEAKPSPRPKPAVAQSPCRRETFEGIPLTHCVAEPA